MKTQLRLLKVQPGWTPPAGLDHSRPRSVRLTAAGKFLVGLAFALVLAGIGTGVGLAVVAAREARTAEVTLRDAVATQGEVIRIWRSSGKDRQPWITYRFNDGRSIYQGDSRLPLRVWQTLRAGTVIPVHYVPSQPELSYPFDYIREPMPAWVPLLLGVSLMGSGPLALIPIRRQRWLLANGRHAQGIVTEVGRMRRGSHGEKLGVTVHYEFHLLSGALARGKAGPIKQPPPVGSPITVLYDPENPRRSTPYPFQSPLVTLA